METQVTRPCGYKTGRLKNNLAHYRSCQHPVCKERLQAWANLVTQASKPGAIKMVKGK